MQAAEARTVILDQLLLDTVDSIWLLIKSDRYIQALIVLCSAIDTFAWLDTDGPTSRSAFKRWTSQYLLPGSGLQCDAEDLYSARCGILHTHAAESSGTVSGEARQIWYWTGEDSKRLLEHEAEGRGDVVLVRVSDLVGAFAAGADRFISELASDAQRAARAQEKAAKWMAWVPAPPAA